MESLHQVTSSSASPPSSPERHRLAVSSDLVCVLENCAVQNNDCFVLLTWFCSANEGPSQLLVSHSQQVREVFAVP